VRPRLLAGLLASGLLGSGLVAAGAGPAAAETFTRRAVKVGGAVIDLSVEVDPGAASSPAEVERWVRRAGEAVTSFYGRFPVARVRMVVERIPGRRIHGTAFGRDLVRVRLGREAARDALDRDWVMTHEMLHLGFPDLDRRHTWMQEGLSTYFEPIARARVGQLTPDAVWRELFDGLPKGLPGPGEGGLDQTPSWGATYWGGALFWLLVDLEIRERTRDRRSADDVLRSILDAGGDGGTRWTMARVIAVGDRATGTTAMATVYRRLAGKRWEIDLDRLAARLGVRPRALDDQAPLAAIRRSITAPPRASRCPEARATPRRPPPGATSPTPCRARPAPYARPGTPYR
jgi:hypothetical protein